ncbi:MAG: protein-L-isoaspartate O-methyltransferase family protein [Bdellovibrio bacteriovorus]
MDTDSDRARFNMIHQQIRPWDVLDERVLEVMEGLGREPFVPDAYQGLAYADIEIPLGPDCRMLAPKVIGRMLQALAVQPGDKVLELGSGTGYVTACLCRLGGEVVGVEPDPSLAAAARRNLAELGCAGAQILEMDVLDGAVPSGPFQAIALNGSLPDREVLGPLEQRLAVGGRLFCILGEAPAMEASLITRVGARDFRREALFETSASPLAASPRGQAFVF